MRGKGARTTIKIRNLDTRLRNLEIKFPFESQPATQMIDVTFLTCDELEKLMEIGDRLAQGNDELSKQERAELTAIGDRYIAARGE